MDVKSERKQGRETTEQKAGNFKNTGLGRKRKQAPRKSREDVEHQFAGDKTEKAGTIQVIKAAFPEG